jgi:nucleotide-binding universal stress UspA family protein
MSLHVLVPVDGSSLSEKALEYVLDHHPDATVTVLYVLDPVESVYTSDSGMPGFGEEWVGRARGRGEDILEAAAAAAADRGREVETVMEEGKPARVVADYVEGHGVDHVVMGSHGRRGISRVVLGSVAESVMRTVTVPVTIIR